MRKRKKKNKLILFILKITFILLLVTIFYFVKRYYDNRQIAIEKEKLTKEIASHYSDYMITNGETNLYGKINGEYVIYGKLSSDLELELDSIDNQYYKLSNLDYYIYYKDVDKLESINSDKHYKNYIIYNENIITNENIKLYITDEIYYEINESLSLPIIIKEDNSYYVEYDNRLVYVLKNDVKEIVINQNNNLSHTTSIAVLNYHYVINKDAKEHLECTQIICHTDTQFTEHMKYLTDNNFYTATMRDLELFIEGKVQLPAKTVVITIDDGWYVSRTITILEEYNVHATLFLIGSLASPTAYVSDNLEIHSHSWNLHKLHECPGSFGGGITCLDKDYILEDLTKSRQSLNNTTYFCYPFYEYNNYAISLLREAGFTMAFANGNRKVTVGTNKFIVPRFGIINDTPVTELASFVN